MKRKMSILLLLLMLVNVFQPAVGMSVANGSSQKPVLHWASEAMDKWIELGLLKGDKSGKLQPDETITRAELAALINRVFNLTDMSSGNFSDVEQGKWYAQDMAKAKAAGYLTGYTDKSVKPLRTITREEAASIFARVFLNSTSSVPTQPVMFKDADQISQFAWEGVTQLSTLGYITGYSDGTFKGKLPVTRAEAISIMNRITPVIINKAGIYDAQNWKGNVLVSVANVTLKNLTIQGDLYLTEGIGEGHIILDNVTVTGNIFIRGGGVDSITVRNSKLNTVQVNKKNQEVHFILEGTSSVGKLQANSGAILENRTESGEGFEQIVISKSLPPFAKVRLIGRLSRVITESATVDAKPIDIIIDGTIEEFILNRKANIRVSPTGTIRSLKIGSTASGSILEGKIEKIDNAGANVTYMGKILPKSIGTTTTPTNNSSVTSGSTSSPTRPRPTPEPTAPPVEFSVTAGAGKAAGTTKVQANVTNGLHLAIKVSHEDLTDGTTGSQAPTGGTVINPYIAGTDISGVDRTINKYVGVYLLDSNNNIEEFKQIILSEAAISAKQWNLIWDDEFDGNNVDTSKWNFVNKGDGFGNSELQFYTDRQQNTRIEDGALVIEAHKENYQGMGYTSAKLTTEDKAHWTYGKYEIRAKLPTGQGMWPAIWMMPQDMDMYGTWPASGEIDIMEQVGNEPDVVYGTLHYGTPHTSSGYAYKLTNGEAFADDYHTFTTEWEPGELRWYVDGILYAVQNDWFSLDSGQPTDYTYPAPFDRDFYLQLNLAVGGTWPGSPDPTTAFPQKMLVDYVKVYEMDEQYGYRQPADERPGQRDQSTTVLAKAPLADGNYIYNGQFSEDNLNIVGIEGVVNSDYWTFAVGFNGAATIENDNNTMKVNITNTGDANYSTQLMQQPIPLQFGKTYKVSFDAKASGQRPIEVKLGSGGDGGWKDYAAHTFNLNTNMETYEFSFKMQSFTHNNARLEMNLGGSTGAVWMDNFSLVETEEVPVINRLPLADGNYIYNGSFDQGSGHMGYWSWITANSAVATATVASNTGTKQLKGNVINGGSQADSVQLVQDNIYLKPDTYYVVSFDAKAEQATNIEVEVIDSLNNTNYSGVQSIPITTEMKRKQFYFRFDSQQERLVKLRVKLGGSTKTVTLDQFRMDERSIVNISDQPVFIQAEQYIYQDGITVGTIPSGSTVVNSFGAGNSISYLVDVAENGNYYFAYRVNTTEGGGIKLLMDDMEVNQTVIPNTNGKWQTIISDPVHLDAGLQLIKLHSTSGEIIINWLAIATGVNEFSLDDADNLIKNGKFNDDLENWSFWTEASANVVNDNGQLKATVNSAGGQSWSIQSKQSGIPLITNKFYTLSFDARASVDRKVSVDIENASNGRYLQDQTIDLQTTMKHYAFDFEMTAGTDLNSSLVFFLGNVGNVGTLGNHSIWIDNVKLQVTNKVAPLTATIEPGTAPGTTTVSAVTGSGHHLAVMVGNSSVAVPNFGDRIPQIAGVINPYNSGSDLSGVDSVTNRYVAVYELNSRNEIEKFKSYVLTGDDISPTTASDPADVLAYSNIQPGTSHGTTRISAAVDSGNHLVAKISHQSIQTPSVGDISPTGATVVNPYVSGTDLSGVEAITNKYVGLYEVDSDHRIVKFSLIALTSANIKTENWQMVWSDEFDGSTIDTSKWNFVQGGGGYGNQELQNYTNRTDNVRIENGALVIEARKENYQGSGYTSAKLDTSGKAKWTYGRYEIKAQLPEGQGLWPAIWMMPEDMNVYGTWPASGEIDIMEALGHEPGTIHGTLHYGVEHASSGQSYTLPGGKTFTDDYHTYAVEWEPGEIRFYVDDILYSVKNDWFAYNYENPDVYTYPAPFDRDFYMQLNVAVGGEWPGDPDASTVFPEKMLVDYVRVYQLDDYKYRIPPGERPGLKDTRGSGSDSSAKKPTADGNYIYNGAFDQNDPNVEGIKGIVNSNYWTFNNGTDFGAQATAAHDNGAMRVDITNGGGATYAVQLIQKPIPIEMGKIYKISMDVKASSNRNIEVKTSQGGEGGWTDYGKGNKAITTEMKTYSYTFKMLSNTHNTARLEINLGGATGSVWIDNVRFEEVTADTVVERAPLGDGNFIYNGRFELGANYTAYWNSDKDDTATATAQVNPKMGLREFHVAITNGGSSDTSVQLKQKNLHLVKDNWYEVDFQARSKAPRGMKLQIAGNTESFALTTENQKFSYIFKMNSNTDINGELQFLLGGNDADVFIDNVEMKQYFPPLSVMVRAENFNVKDGVILTSASGGGNYVVFDDDTDSISTDITVPEAGEYILSFKVSTTAGGKSIGFELDGAAKQLLNVTNTHGNERWSVVTERVELTAGTHTLRLSGKGVNLEWVEQAPNLVDNTTMETTTDPWVLWVGTEAWAGNAKATMGLENGEMKLDVQNQGSEFWSVQFNQMDIPLKQGKNYRLSFDARSTINRQMRVSVELDGGSPNYSLNTVDLNNGMTRFSFDFTMDQISQDNVKVNFIIGNVSGALAPHQIYLDNVSLSETGEAVPDANVSLENLALNKPATASSGNAGLAFDGNMGTRWESVASDPQSIEVDLGSIHEIDYVKLNWEAAYGKSYSISVSTNGTDWNTVFSTSAGNGGIDEIRFEPVQARYVKLDGSARGTDYGYSLYEMSVYPFDPGYIVEPAVPPVLMGDATDAIVKRDIDITFTDNELWRNSITGVKVKGTTLVNGVDYTIHAGSITLKAGVFAGVGDYDIIIESIRFNDATVNQTISPIPPTVDLAARKLATASSGDAAAAFDVNDGTRWVSDSSDPQWIEVDLGDMYDIGRVVLKWEGAYGKSYSVETSLNGTDWNEVYSTTSGDGDTDTFSFASTRARYVKLTGTERGTEYSYSLWNFEVYPYDPSGLMTPPALTVNMAGNAVGEDIQINFSDDPTWRTAITNILIDGVSVTGAVTMNGGIIEIPAHLLIEAKDYLITIEAAGYSDTSVVQTVNPIKLAINAALASSGTAELAVDGNMGTRWESEQGVDPQWITVDLGGIQTVQRVVIDWEGARASSYIIEVSEDGTQWTEVYATMTGSGAKDDQSFTPSSAQYVRITGTVRALPYGYSIFEISIY